MTIQLAAVDLGASSGRVMLGRVGNGTVELTEAHRFRNGAVRLPDGLYWDVLGLYQDILIGLRSAAGTAAQRGEPLAGVAVDAWAVDYGLLGQDGALLGNPRHYRDPRTEPVIAQVHRRVDPARLYRHTGLQHLPFNTLYQLAAEPTLAERKALLIPDLIGYWLTGAQVTEETNASSTGLLDAKTGDWDRALIEQLGIPAGLFADVVRAGQVIGPLAPLVRDELGVDHDILLSTVGSHDTASAVVGVPADNPRFGYISCGTWGLVGVELDAPVLTQDSRRANFTNERGVDGTIRYLHNVMGLWLLSESIRAWNLRGLGVDLGQALDAAAQLPEGGPRIDPNDPQFLPPGDMPQRIGQWCRNAGQAVPESVPQVVRCILDSLAAAFAETIEQAERLSGQPIEVVHIVGGGSQNALLCQLTADACQRPVIAGPVEATALGNLVVQARTLGALSGDVTELRRHVRDASSLVQYRPRSGARPQFR
jgi:rhamnulokinase